MTRKSKTALFAGTFNPFTLGHKSIADRALKLCDRLVIGFGYNIGKPDSNLDSNMRSVMRIYEDDSRVEVRNYTGLTVDFARECGADFLVRGVRGSSDFEFESNLAEINLRLSGIETVILVSLPEFSFISSSMVRELKAYGHDVSKFLP